MADRVVPLDQSGSVSPELTDEQKKQAREELLAVYKQFVDLEPIEIVINFKD